ncbi:MAG: PAS domain-containing protein [Flavipsychrobacter sp.]|nr:PAS domain-containing protein [Flavipsychrobacter sp.]
MREKHISIITGEHIKENTILEQLENLGYNTAHILSFSSLSDFIAAGASTHLVLAYIHDFNAFYLQFDSNRDLLSDTAFIIISRIADETHIAEAMQRGIQDYLLTDTFDGPMLKKVILCAAERQKHINDKRNDAYGNSFFQDIPIPMWIYDTESYQIITVNNAAVQSYGYTADEFLSKTIFDIRPDEQLSNLRKEIEVRKPSESYYDAGIWKHQKKDGTIFHVHVYSYHTIFKGKKARLIMATDENEKVIAEEKLKQKATEVDNILETITDAFYTVDNNWNLTYINKEAEKLYGVTREKLLGTCLWDVFPNSRQTGFYSEYQRAMNERVSIHFKEYAPSVGKWILVNAYPKEDGLAVYHTDFTEQKTLEDKVLSEQQNLSAIINNTRDIIWSIDADFNVVMANDAYYDRVKQLANKADYKDVVAEDIGNALIEEWNEYYRRAFLGEQFKIIYYSFANGKKAYDQINFNPIFDEEKKVKGVTIFSRDITEEKKLEQLILIEKKNLSALINNTSDMIWSVDKDLRIVSANNAYKDFVFKLCGIHIETGSSNFWKEKDPELQTRSEQYYERALHESFSIVDQQIVDGKLAFFENSFNPIVGPDGNIIGISCYSRDISLQREHVMKIEVQNEKLKEIAWLQSHKVRGPLANIMGLAQLFDLNNYHESVNGEVINGIIEAANNLDSIIREVVKNTYDALPAIE